MADGSPKRQNLRNAASASDRLPSGVEWEDAPDIFLSMPDLLKTVHWTVTSGALLAEDGWPSGPVRAESGFTAVLDRESRPGNCGTTVGRTGASRWLHMPAHGIIDHLDRDLEDLPEPQGEGAASPTASLEVARAPLRG
jgi:hypothetical protein